ncbi:MAG TPA: flagellin, partial [Planctomycetota bacterium]|nr:flagellin [Planctomycetota bacterium]
RINTNIPALISINSLDRSNEALQKSLQRLSTGVRINTAADDPAGLIVSESLRAQIGSLKQGIDNAQRAANVIATAEGALGEVSVLLVSIRELVIEAANAGTLSQEETDANQLQIDSAIESITRIANTTSFGQQKLLNGTLAFTTASVSAAAISDLSVYAANFGDNSSLTVNLNVTQSAQTGYLLYSGSQVTTAASVEVAGSKGSDVFSFAAATNVSAVVFGINQVVNLTGVSAAVLTSGGADVGVQMYSTGYGADEFVSLNVLSGAFATVDAAAAAATRDVGRDAAGVLNGNSVTGKGNVFNFNSTGLDLGLTVTDGFSGATAFTILGGGGALFQISPDLATSVNIGISSTSAAHLGSGDIGYLNSLVTGGANDLSSDNLDTAADIIDASINDVSMLRGRLGAFQKNVLETAVRSLRVTMENVSAAESLIRDADFASETSELTRAQILVNAGISVLAAANASPQNVLALLG